LCIERVPAQQAAPDVITVGAVQATVGAGLPIIATLKHLRETGDKIISIEGIFSGTLSYLFNAFGTDDRTFSTIVTEAKQAGFTEPDPREDLSGLDVARKVCDDTRPHVFILDSCTQSDGHAGGHPWP